MLTDKQFMLDDKIKTRILHAKSKRDSGWPRRVSLVFTETLNTPSSFMYRLPSTLTKMFTRLIMRLVVRQSAGLSSRSFLLLLLWRLRNFSTVVRMAERSKAPDSRLSYLLITQWERAFWSPNGGVGSNPTPDKMKIYLFTLFFISFFLNRKLKLSLKDRPNKNEFMRVQCVQRLSFVYKAGYSM